MGISLYRGPIGEPGGEVHLQGTSRASKRWLWKWVCISLWALYERNLKGGLLYWRPRRICKGRLWKQASSIWAPLGEKGGDAALLGILRER